MSLLDEFENLLNGLVSLVLVIFKFLPTSFYLIVLLFRVGGFFLQLDIDQLDLLFECSDLIFRFLQRGRLLFDILRLKTLEVG